MTFTENAIAISPAREEHVTTNLAQLAQDSTFCYESEIPAFVEAELERLYGNFFSTLIKFKGLGSLENLSSYVVFAEGRIKTLFLFRRVGRSVQVLNEVIELNPEEVRHFADTMFALHPRAQLVSFHAVQLTQFDCDRPFQHYNCLENIVLSLPETGADYFARLGKSTRKTLQNSTNKLKRDFPSFENKILEKGEVSEAQIRAIVKLNRERMLASGKIPIIDEAGIQRIILAVRVYGFTCVATIDGEICAGAISYRVGENYFMEVCAHDGRYERYRLGMLYRYLTVCECIRQHGRECHFLWGRQEFKFSLLGVQRDLYDLVIYRSRFHLLCHITVACKTAFKAGKRRIAAFLRSS